jgi:hemolysin III
MTSAASTQGSVAVREPVNGWFHFGGALLAAAGLAWLGFTAMDRDSFRHLLGALVFGATAVMMFSASALYHLRPASPRAPIYRRFDHAMIYLFIAGTYTPVCLVALWPSVQGKALLAVVWTLAAAGAFMGLSGRHMPRGVATAIYLGLGWAAVPVAPSLFEHPALGGWLLTGGIFYTVGALVYWRKRPFGRPGVIGFHEVWHLCVIAGSAAHFWAVRAHVLPL